MSDDPRTDFFSAAANGAPDDPGASTDSRTDFFAADKSLPMPKTTAGSEAEPENTWMGAIRGDADAAAALASGAIVGRTAALARTVNRVLPEWIGGEGSKAQTEADINKTEKAFTYEPTTPEGKYAIGKVGEVTQPIAEAARNVTGAVIGDENVPAASDAFAAASFPGVRSAVTTPLSAASRTWKSAVAAGKAAETAPAMTAEDVLARNAANSQGNMGAAAAAPSLEGVSPALKDAIAKSGNIDPDALQRHIDADTLPMPEGTSPLQLRKGQATFDGQQISDEKNLRADPDTQDILANSITDQNDKLGASMGEIRRRATPDIVQRSNIEHGQAGVDAIKTEDNAAILDTRAKYQALADANGGALPLDTSSALQGIRAQLNQGFLNKTARDNPVVSEVLDQMQSGQPLSFEQFENARTNLADVQRGGGSDAKAAAIVRGQLESMPLPPEAAQLKGLADTARAAAKARFDRIKENPAYDAVVNDNVPKTPNGLHVIGSPSPLADTFMDRYFLGNGPTASRAYVGRMQGIMANNPDFAPAVEGSALNKLRDAAGLDIYDNGNFKNASYRSARDAMDKKADVLMSPQSATSTEQLKRVSGYVNDEPKDASVNRSNTALTLQRFGAMYPETPGITGTLADYGTDIGAAHLGPVGYAAKKIGSAIVKNARDRKAVEATRTAKLNFARDATAPGAGINMPTAPPIARATGGKVDHEALVQRLISRWKAAKKATDATTKPLLNLPDASIVRALEISQEHI